MNSTYNSTGIDNLIKKYQNEISAREEQIKHNQLQIEKDSKTICQLNNKIQTLKDLVLELKKADEEESANKLKETTSTKTSAANHTKTSSNSWSHPDWSSDKTWIECNKDLNKLIEDLKKKNNTTQLDFFGAALWPVD